ncbi:MAG: hypothetical protein H0T66_05365 [Geodermatophilaceae bacterium]|nr:hypothetical protein [Geodermatophilaceae bacterium]MDQ3455010.1 hypothetical protein [Actinomycetota bacterium]
MRWRWVGPVAAVAVGLYLLAWAWRWPHSDTRNNGAMLVGTGVLVVGLAAVALARSGRRSALLVVLPPVLAAVFGLVVLSGVSSDQRAACGALAACTSLLPGL